MVLWLCRMFWCVTITPFGTVVEPDVYCSNAISVHLAVSLAVLAGCGKASVMIRCRPGTSSRSRSAGATPVCEVAIPTPALATIEVSRSAPRLPCGTDVGTATSPARTHEKKAPTNASPGGSTSSPGLPGAPQAASAPAAASTRLSSSANVSVDRLQVPSGRHRQTEN